MKRQNKINGMPMWEYFISDCNIERSIQQSIKGKRNHVDLMEIAEDPETRIIIKQMCDMFQFPEHHYVKRVIYEGKKRNIWIVTNFYWRILHHMLINTIEQVFEKRFIDHTYGCIRGRGQRKGSEHCQKFANKYKYTLKCDIHKFYPSIKHQILYDLICKVIKDKKILALCKIIVFSHRWGIPIGNLPSQLFGNIYMSKFDYYVKHNLKFKNYIRYVDDFIFCSNNKQELVNIRNILEDWFKENLGLTLSRCMLFKTKQGIDFLGYRHFPGYRLLRKKTATRVKRRITKLERQYDNGKSLISCLSIISSYEGWISWAYCYNLAQKLNMEKIRQDITYKEQLKGKPIIMSGKRVKTKDMDNIIVNAYKTKIKRYKDNYRKVIQVQFIKNGKTYYFETGSRALINQIMQVQPRFSMNLRCKPVCYAA